VWPGVRQAGLAGQSPALTPGQRRRRRRLDVLYGLFRQRRGLMLWPLGADLAVK